MTRYRLGIGLSAAALAAFASGSAQADPQLRLQVDQHGDILLIGNTLGRDCANGTPAPVVGSVGDCGDSVSDPAIDVFWQSSAAAAVADTSIAPGEGRSTAVLAIPAGVTVTHARLYWAGIAPEADVSVTLDRPGVFSQVVAATSSATVPDGTGFRYQSSADVTALVQAQGSGAYRLAGVDSIPIVDVADRSAFSAWTLVVFYEDAAEPLRQLSIFDGLDAANTGSGVVANITGFLIPQTGIDAKIGVIAYLSDGQTGGDTLTFNDTELDDGLAGSQFFNGSRTFLGAPVSNAGDLPQLTGDARSMSGFELDVVDVTDLVSPGGTSAQVVAKAGGDLELLLGAFVTSITTFKPDFESTTKTAVDLDGGALLAGDVVEYTISIVNDGNDASLDTILTDEIPEGTTYVPGSIEITQGTGAGLVTDIAGDDLGEYDAGGDLIRVRLGTGATSATGGSMAIGETATVTFQVTIDDDASGVISNLAEITARGVQGSPTETTPSNGGTTTDSTVDECADDGDCTEPTPLCLVDAGPGPNTCVDCLSDADCGGNTPVCNASNDCVGCSSDADCAGTPLTPACQLTGALDGACTECSANNDDLCGGSNPICVEAVGECGCIDTDGDSECGGPNSGVVCNGPAGSCVPGCSTADGRNDCPLNQTCSEQDGDIGICLPVACVDDDDCEEPLGTCDTTQIPSICVDCLDDDDCVDPLICDTDINTCVECVDDTTCIGDPGGDLCLDNGNCGCTDDSDCGDIDSERVCNTALSVCQNGCRGEGFGNGCADPRECTSVDATIGTCFFPDECQTDDDCPDELPVCDTENEPNNICVGCVLGTDCENPTPVCDPDTQTCEGCQSDDDCTDPLFPACNTIRGPLQGSCTECAATNTDLCVGDTPVCLTDVGVCGCDQDSQCGEPDSGIICGEAESACKPGCSTAEGRNDCPPDGFCSEQDGDEGICLDQCVTDDDCEDPELPVCDTDEEPHVCVECLADADCPDDLVCDTEDNTCVECTPEDTGNCDPDEEGGACLPDGTCGCLEDEDCGPGQVCDVDTNECGPGEITGSGGGGGGGEGPATTAAATTGVTTTSGPVTASAAGVGGGGGGEEDLDGLVASGGACDCTTAGDGRGDSRGALAMVALGLFALGRRTRRATSKRAG